MSTLRGIFPEPKKEQKKNFIRENVKQLKFIQGRASKEAKFATKTYHVGMVPHNLRADVSRGTVKSSPSNKSKLKVCVNTKSSPTSDKKRLTDVKIKKGDMAEFLTRKELLRQRKPADDEEDLTSEESRSQGLLRDIGCQTIETNLSQRFDESTKITTLYAKKEDDEAKLKASGDGERTYQPPLSAQSLRRAYDDMADYERPRSRLNAILERKNDQHNKDPYLPTGYQKGVLPKYLRERKESGVKEAEGVKADDETAVCPPGHVTLPDNERKETLRMLRNSFAELVSELNKMPVKTDTLRMRNRKMELEKQLAKLEEGIKVFSRPKVFVKIGE